MTSPAPSTSTRRLVLANPRGFCAGVVRAIDIVHEALRRFGAPIYVRKEIVHNQVVVQRLKGLGVIFVEELTEVPAGEICIFSAHGVSPQVREEAQRRGLRPIDATCPLVAKVHLEVLRFQREGYQIVMIGHKGHEETEGTLGEAPQQMLLVETLQDALSVQVRTPDKVAVVTQTTLSIDDTAEIIAALQQRFPKLVVPKKADICYATQNRQDGVKDLARECQVVLVVGNRNSSNSNRLVEVASNSGAAAYLVPSLAELRPEWYASAESIGITSGASTPESAVEELIARLRSEGWDRVDSLDGLVEDVTFQLPEKDFARAGGKSSAF